MGYLTRVTGEIRIHPPLTWAEINRDGEARKYLYDDCDVRFLAIEETTETEEGTFTRKTVTAIIPPCEEPYKAYEAEENLQEIVDIFQNNHTFTGYLEGQGEEGDMWRLYVRAGRAVKVEPRITWPEES